MYAATNIKRSDYMPSAREQTRYHRAKKQAFQDGAEFYDSANGIVIARYPDLIKNDWDTAGAERARRQFLADHPLFEMEGS